MTVMFINTSSGAAVTSVVGTANEIAVSTVGTVATVSLSPNIIVPRPASGQALVLQGADIGALNLSSTTTQCYMEYDNGTTPLAYTGVAMSAGALITGSASGDLCLRAQGGSFRVSTDSGSSTAFGVIGGNNGVFVNAPASSNTALVVNGAATANAMGIISGNSATTGAADFLISRAGSTANAIEEGPNIVLFDTSATTLSCLQQSGGQTELWQFNSGWAQIFKIDTSRRTVFAGGSQAFGIGTTPDSTLHVLGPNNCGLRIDYSGAAGNNYYDATAHNFRTTAAVNELIITSTGTQVGNPTGGLQGAGTINATGLFINGVAVSTSGGVTTGTFTGTLTGTTTAVTGTVAWTLAGTAVLLQFPAGMAGSSNLNSFTMTGLPSAIQPAHNQQAFIVLEDNGVTAVMGLAQLASGSGTVTFSKATALNTYSATGFTATGNKGISQGTTIAYSIA